MRCPPPQLARDAPVLDVLHPVTVDILVFFGDETDFVLHDGARGGLRQLLHRKEPLHRKLRLDSHARALGVAHVVRILLGLFEQTGTLQVALDHAAQLEAIHPLVDTHLAVDRPVVVEDVDRLQPVFLAQHVVVHVVRRRHLQGTRAEGDVYIRVADHRNRAPDERHHHAGVLRQPLVALVVGIDAQRRIAQNGLGARRSHDEVFVRPLDRIAQVVELAVRLLEDHLFVRQRGPGRGIPVDHAHAAVDAPLAVEVAEDLDDPLGADVVHRETGAVPVARSPQLAQLPQNHAAVLLLPLPRVFEELLARERRLLDAALLELGHHLRLGSDRGVVHTRHPAGIFSLHAGAADQHVLQRIVEHVAHVEHPRHVGRRNDDRIGFARIGFGVEQSVPLPVVVPFLLDLLRSVFVGNLHIG